MFRKFLLPLLAVAGVLFAIYSVVATSRAQLVAQPVASPSESNWSRSIAGAGLVEANSQNIEIGTPTPGLVVRVAVKEGDAVKAGDELFKLDDRTLQAEKAVRQSALHQAVSKLTKLENQPRPEDIAPAKAKVAEGEANLGDARKQLELLKEITDPRAVSREDLSHREFAVQSAQARLDQAKADLATLLAGAWKYDLEIARADVAAAKASLASTETELERLLIRAPIEGVILQKNVRVGEFAQTGALATPLMLMGNVDPLNVRVDVDENDAHRMRPNSPATASPRGDPSHNINLKFVRIEPFVIPKKSLTGDTTERVDTRVLQVLYSFDRSQAPNVWPGQQMDIHISDLSEDKPLSVTQPVAGR